MWQAHLYSHLGETMGGSVVYTQNLVNDYICVSCWDIWYNLFSECKAQCEWTCLKFSEAFSKKAIIISFSSSETLTIFGEC